MSRRTIEVDYLARVEGEGAMHVVIDGDRVESVELRIFEPPRFFEAFLRGRSCEEVADITARICGICPVAYQMSSVHAVERALGIRVEGPLRELRRLLYCGEWIESHALHVYMLHAPDFLGYESAMHMAKDHRGVVERGLRLKKAGNTLMKTLAGREIHPINVRVGGFYRAPRREALTALLPELRWAAQAAEETARWVATFHFPQLELPYNFVSLSHPAEYPMNEGRLASSRGMDIDASEYEAHFEERHAQRSHALHSVHKEHGAYFVGPMARYALASERLPDPVRALAAELGLGAACANPFKSILVRSLEILYACLEAQRIIEGYDPPAPAAAVELGPGEGWAITEAPRGLLYHRYRLGAGGIVEDARIVPPTSQNQLTIEGDLRALVESHVHLPDAELRERCEQAIRNYDPCISCATHFLDLRVERR